MKRLVTLSASLLVAPLLLSAAPSRAASHGLEKVAQACQQGAANVMGIVVDASTRQPLAGALVLVNSTKGTFLTDSQGRFSITGVDDKAGAVTVLVQLSGYTPAIVNLSLGTEAANIQLQRLGRSGGSVASAATPAASPQVQPNQTGRDALDDELMMGRPPASVSTPFPVADLCEEEL